MTIVLGRLWLCGLQRDEQLLCVLVPKDNRLDLGGQRVEVEEIIEGAIHLVRERLTAERLQQCHGLFPGSLGKGSQRRVRRNN